MAYAMIMCLSGTSRSCKTAKGLKQRESEHVLSDKDCKELPTFDFSSTRKLKQAPSDALSFEPLYPQNPTAA